MPLRTRRACAGNWTKKSCIDTPYTDRCVGLINDDETEVGKVHLGVVHLFDVDIPRCAAAGKRDHRRRLSPGRRTAGRPGRLRKLVPHLPGSLFRQELVIVITHARLSRQSRHHARRPAGAGGDAALLLRRSIGNAGSTSHTFGWDAQGGGGPGAGRRSPRPSPPAHARSSSPAERPRATTWPSAAWPTDRAAAATTSSACAPNTRRSSIRWLASRNGASRSRCCRCCHKATAMRRADSPGGSRSGPARRHAAGHRDAGQ